MSPLGLTGRWDNFLRNTHGHQGSLPTDHTSSRGNQFIAKGTGTALESTNLTFS